MNDRSLANRAVTVTLIVVLGLIVGFIVIALFAPMISLIQTVSSPAKK